MSVATCPTCGQQFDVEQSSAMPFCSARCRRIDLGRWLKEDISIPFRESEEWDPADGADQVDDDDGAM